MNTNPGIGIDAAFPRSAPSDPSAPHVRQAARPGGRRVRPRDPGPDLGEHRLRRDQLDLHPDRPPAAANVRRADRPRLPRPSALRVLLRLRLRHPALGQRQRLPRGCRRLRRYDFTIVDQTYDAIVEAGHHVLVELAFTPRDLLPDEAAELEVVRSPTVLQQLRGRRLGLPAPGLRDAGAGSSPPTRGTVSSATATQEVSSWLWELWNEPDIFYWRGTPEQFYELYSVTARAVRGVLPNAKVGGPAVTGGGVDFLRGFLSTRATSGDPIDFVSFHTKGSAFTPWRVYGPTGGAAPERQNPSAHQDAVRDPPDAPGDRGVRRVPRAARDRGRVRRRRARPTTASTTTPTSASRTPSTTRCSRSSCSRRSSTSTRPRPSRSSRPRPGASTSRASGSSRARGRSSPAGGIEKPLLNAYRMLGRLGERRIERDLDAAHAVTLLDQAERPQHAGGDRRPGLAVGDGHRRGARLAAHRRPVPAPTTSPLTSRSP